MISRPPSGHRVVRFGQRRERRLHRHLQRRATAGQRPATSARTPAGPASALTAAASCWTTMPAWSSTRPGTAPRPPRRRQSPAPAHHGQDPAQEPPHRHALHQTRRRSGRGHRHPRPIPQALRASPACTFYISAGQRLLRWIYGQCYEDPCIGEDLPRGAAPRSLCARPPRSQGGAGPARRRFCGAGGTTFPARARAAGITTSAPSEVRTAKEAGSFSSRMPRTSAICSPSPGLGRRQRITTRWPTSAGVRRTSSR